MKPSGSFSRSQKSTGFLCCGKREGCGRSAKTCRNARGVRPRLDGAKAVATKAMNQDFLLKRGLLLEYATLGWNVVGVGVMLAAARATGSGALAGFGLDSLIEIGASTVVVWELRGTGRGRERAALRLIGAAFFALAIYLGAVSFHSLLVGTRPETSRAALLWLAMSCGVMLLLARGKAKTGAQLGNKTLQTDRKSVV